MHSSIPIGILTRNRAVYLHETLSSMRGATPGVKPIIYDDASTQADATRFLYTADEFAIEHEWPRWPEWADAGLDRLQDHPTVRGLRYRFRVVKLNPLRVGVVAASCQAITHLFASNPGAPAVVLLQDDIVFARGWLETMQSHFAGQAILAGMHIDYRPETSYYTAQCYHISRAFYDQCRGFFDAEYLRTANCFDVKICKAAREAGFAVDLITPYICQHIGVQSQVRTICPFKAEDYIRLGLNHKPELLK